MKLIQNVKGQKRNREQVSPKTKRPDIYKKRILNLKREISTKQNQVVLDDISPSPVFESKFKDKANYKEKENSNCECQQCIQNENTFKTATHHDRCGCHSCFLEHCTADKSLNKDKLRNNS